MAIFEMPQIQLPVFHFKISVLMFLSTNALYCHSGNRRTSTIVFCLLFPSVPFSGVIKREYREEISKQGYQMENREFPRWFLSKKREIWLFSKIFVVILTQYFGSKDVFPRKLQKIFFQLCFERPFNQSSDCFIYLFGQFGFAVNTLQRSYTKSYIIQII